MNEKLTITVTKTADGQRDYLQIMSADMLSTNIVLVAEEIVVEDHREEAWPTPKPLRPRARKRSKP